MEYTGDLEDLLGSSYPTILDLTCPFLVCTEDEIAAIAADLRFGFGVIIVGKDIEYGKWWKMRHSDQEEMNTQIGGRSDFYRTGSKGEGAWMMCSLRLHCANNNDQYLNTFKYMVFILGAALTHVGLAPSCTRVTPSNILVSILGAATVACGAEG